MLAEDAEAGAKVSTKSVSPTPVDNSLAERPLRMMFMIITVQAPEAYSLLRKCNTLLSQVAFLD